MTGVTDILTDQFARFSSVIDIEAGIEAEMRVERPSSVASSLPVGTQKETVRKETVELPKPPLETPPCIGCPDTAGETAKRLYHALTEEKAATDLAREIGLPLPAVLTALTELELYGVVVCGAGQRYTRIG